jgi:hypothetical protein
MFLPHSSVVAVLAVERGIILSIGTLQGLADDINGLFDAPAGGQAQGVVYLPELGRGKCDCGIHVAAPMMCRAKNAATKTTPTTNAISRIMMQFLEQVETHTACEQAH